MLKKAYLKNEIVYDHNDSYIQQIRLEAIYPMYLLLTSKINVNDEAIEYKSLSDLPIKFDDLFKIHTPVKINGKIYPYGVCLFNKWCDFKDIQITTYLGPKIVPDYIFNDSKNIDEYNKRMHNLSKRMFWFTSIHPDLALTISLDEFNNLNLDRPRELIGKLPKNPYVGQHIYTSILRDVNNLIPDDSKLKSLLKIKVNIKQLSRLLCGIGYIADNNNVIESDPITSSIISGLDEETFFQTVPGTRKGIIDKSEVTPQSGYIERQMVVNLSPIELDMDDCGTTLGFQIQIQSKEHAKSLKNRYFINASGDIELYNAIDVENDIGKTYLFRSPICCANPNFKICKVCFGNYKSIKSKYVGILAGQSISERLTQLTMRTFHTSGSCDLPIDNKIVDIIQSKLINIVIDKEEKRSTLIFKPRLTEPEIRKLKSLIGFAFISEIIDDETHMTYDDIKNVVNRDVTVTINEVNKLLQSQHKNDIQPIDNVYVKFINAALSVGQIHSTFVEIVLCNMYVTQDGIIWREALQKNINAVPYKKLNVKTLHTVVSKLLGLLYEPNEQSICKFADLNNPLPISTDTVLERFWNDI